ncbi:alkaline phosphatase family protein [Cognatilysobacter tabacisoli]|uniref:alkaline phosphatase family protein n=1 Tax=Cognatilysobacter tabacisoli TaxID=2315424 RepID=UPI000E6AE51F|nr:ectonucleotide pyrophosphatase/phosphodiesterase [Lysobacter tabacisoli]
MRILTRAATAALLGGLLAACATPAPPLRTASTDPVVLVSLDGFHPDYLDPSRTPHLSRLARDGVRAAWMNPSYPSLTFPNHYTVVTGLRPDRHGIVQNTMRDPALGGFSLRNREAVSDGRWWGGEPIWVTAKKAGLPNATMFWPGAEAAIGGVRPDRWQPFDYEVTIEQRVDTVVGWMREPVATRPRITTLYFEHVDKAAHDAGPQSPEALAAVRTLDAAIGRLLDGLRAGGVDDEVNLVIVSDHGMAAVPLRNAVATEDMVDPALATPVSSGQSLGFAPVAGREREAEAALLGRHARYECWRKGELPARWHYGRHPRVPPIVCQMDEGWDAGSREWLQRRDRDGVRGSHGFDPALPSMRAVFIAHGPAFRRGVTLPAFDNVDVYPLLARLVGVAPVPNDGDPRTLAPALSD